MCVCDLDASCFSTAALAFEFVNSVQESFMLVLLPTILDTVYILQSIYSQPD